MASFTSFDRPSEEESKKVLAELVGEALDANEILDPLTIALLVDDVAERLYESGIRPKLLRVYESTASCTPSTTRVVLQDAAYMEKGLHWVVTAKDDSPHFVPIQVPSTGTYRISCS